MSTRSMHGFALPIVLVSVAITALSVLSLTRSGYGRLVTLREERALLAADIAAETAQARLLHLLVTEPKGIRSLDVARGPSANTLLSERSAGAGRNSITPIIMDGRQYALPGIAGNDGAVVVALQDEAGLINLNGASEEAVTQMLLGMGFQNEDAGRLAHSLADFIDADDLRRQGGADGPDYRRAGLMRARNRVLDSPLQALGALGWEEAFIDAKFEVLLGEAAALTRTAPFNPNTGTALALRSVFGIDAKLADKLIAMRERQLLLSVDEVSSLTGSARIDSHIRASPARSTRLRLEISRGTSQESYVYVSSVSIAHDEAEGPVSVTRLEMPTRSRRREGVRADDRLVSLPSSASLFAP